MYIIFFPNATSTTQLQMSLKKNVAKLSWQPLKHAPEIAHNHALAKHALS